MSSVSGMDSYFCNHVEEGMRGEGRGGEGSYRDMRDKE